MMATAMVLGTVMETVMPLVVVIAMVPVLAMAMGRALVIVLVLDMVRDGVMDLEMDLALGDHEIAALFLDVDGVLNHAKFRHGLTSKLDTHSGTILTASQIAEATEKFDADCVAELARIVRETGCKIVLSSAWRLSGIQEGSAFINALVKTGTDENVRTIRNALIDRTPDLNYFGKSREDEILDWLSNHPEVERYVAVDDWNLNLDGNSVRTDDEYGLTQEKADEVIRKLKG